MRSIDIRIAHQFTEGFDTPDLKDAKALLDELSKVGNAPKCCSASVRFWLITDIDGPVSNVRFTPESGHAITDVRFLALYVRFRG